MTMEDNKLWKTQFLTLITFVSEKQSQNVFTSGKYTWHLFAKLSVNRYNLKPLIHKSLKVYHVYTSKKDVQSVKPINSNIII
jgi:hypothetical protein